MSSPLTFARFLKFGSLANLEKLIRGQVHMKTLGYFRTLEEVDGRGDGHEALSHHLQPGQIRLKIGDYEVPAEDLAAPVLMHLSVHDAVHVFCMAGLTVDYFQQRAQERSSPITDQLAGLGQYVLVIKPRPFLERFMQAAEKDGFRYQFAPVNYFDPTTYHGPTTLFHKRTQYAWQQEVRIIADPSGNPYRNVDIGSIEDIAGLYEIDVVRTWALEETSAS